MNQKFLEQELIAVRALIEESVGKADSLVADSLLSLSQAGGKFLRPTILLLSAMTGRYEAQKMRPLAAAIEILHIASLVHDDVIDESSTRRGLPAVHTVVGNKNAVLAGDFLFSRCMELVASSVNAQNTIALARAMRIMVQAEMRQDTERWNFNPSLRRCIKKIQGKTAVLFSLSSRTGSEQAKATRPIITALTRSAFSAGIAFQIQDDVLDWVADEKVIGKKTLNDVREGLCTLPLALALSKHSPELRPLLQPKKIETSCHAVQSIVLDSGAVTQAQDLARMYIQRALFDLHKLPQSFAQETLISIYSSFVDRAL